MLFVCSLFCYLFEVVIICCLCCLLVVCCVVSLCDLLCYLFAVSCVVYLLLWCSGQTQGLLEFVYGGLQHSSSSVRNVSLFAIGQFSENLQVGWIQRGLSPSL